MNSVNSGFFGNYFYLNDIARTLSVDCKVPLLRLNPEEVSGIMLPDVLELIVLYFL